jgi:hypothetical protein
MVVQALQMMDSPYPTLQDVIWTDSVALIKASDSFQSYTAFYHYVVENLPQNSSETRRRYARIIQRRFFPGQSLDDLIPKVWRSYHDELILTDLMRVMALEAEPAVARFVLQHVLPRTPGSALDFEVAETYIRETYGEFKRKSYQRLLLTCRYLQFLGKYNGDLLVEYIQPPADAFLILLHERLAPTPRIVRLSELTEPKWWRLLGLRQVEEVRQILHEAERAGLISRYTRVDELEQVTTRYSQDEYLGRGMRLT